MESKYSKMLIRENQKNEKLRKTVRKRLEELGEKDLSWLNGVNTGGIDTDCYCQYCEREISLRFYDEIDTELGIHIACSIDCTPTLVLDDIDKFTTMLKWVKVVFELKRDQSLLD